MGGKKSSLHTVVYTLTKSKQHSIQILYIF